jgi:hypothetical protein
MQHEYASTSNINLPDIQSTGVYGIVSSQNSQYDIANFNDSKNPSEYESVYVPLS